MGSYLTILQRGIMNPSLVVVLLVAQLVTVRANAIIRSQFALHDRSGELMRVLSMVDVSDRNMNTWWDQFSVSWAEYDLKVKQDPILYCSSWKMLLKDLAELKTKVDLVVTGLEAKEEQLRQIREILEHNEMGGKSGLHCKEDPNQPICVALDGLDKQAADERTRLMAQLKKVSDEKTKVETYPCDCTYNDWADNWGTCSVSCDVGIKEETRKIRWEKRNSGKDCNPEDAKRTGKCNDGCCPVNCEWEEWGTWSACPEILTSDPQYEHAYRSIKVEHECSQRGGQKCVGKTQKSRQCNILDIKNEKISDLDDEIKSLKDELKGLKEGCTKQEGKTGGTGTILLGGASSITTTTTTTTTTATTTTTTTTTTTKRTCWTNDRGNLPCVFPFTHEGHTFNECTDYKHNGKWCSTKVDKNGVHIGGNWGNCSSVCLGRRPKEDCRRLWSRRQQGGGISYRMCMARSGNKHYG